MSTRFFNQGWLLCILLFGIQNIYAFSNKEAHTTVKDSLIRIDSIVFQARFLKKNIIEKQFKQGDRIALSFHESSGIGISCIKIISPSSYVDTIFDKPDKFDKVIFPIRETGTYTFQFINRTVALQWPIILRKNCRFVLWNINWVRNLSDFVAYDTIRSEPFNFVKVNKDTAILPIINEKIYLQPQRNLIDPPRAVVEMVLPKEVKKWGYWLGVGEAATRQYAQWEKGLSDESIRSPLHAYLEGVVQKLPVNESGNTINYHFTDYEGQTEFVSNGKVDNPKISENHVKAAYGKRLINQEEEEGKEKKMYICLENNHPNSGMNVDVKVLASAVIFKRDTILTDSIEQIKPRIFFVFEDTSKQAVEKELIAFQAGLEEARRKFIQDYRANPNRDPKVYEAQMKQFDYIQSLLDGIAYKYDIKTKYLGPGQDLVSTLDPETLEKVEKESRKVGITTNTQPKPPFELNNPIAGKDTLQLLKIDTTFYVDTALNILDTTLIFASGEYADSLQQSIEFEEKDSKTLIDIIRRLDNIQTEIDTLSNRVIHLLEEEGRVKIDQDALDDISQEIKKNLSELATLDNKLSKAYGKHSTQEIINRLSLRLKKLDVDLLEYLAK